MAVKSQVKKLPTWVKVAAVAVAAYLVWRWYSNNKASSSSMSAGSAGGGAWPAYPGQGKPRRKKGKR